MTNAEALRAVAEKYFHDGDAEILVNEFCYSSDFVEGQRRGHSDAYYILMGVADGIEDEEVQGVRV